MTEHGYRLEAVYNRAQEAVAQGASRADTVRWLSEQGFSEGLTTGEVANTLDEALDGALSIGVEREDVDPSWLGA
jgi:hypothetical protein